MVETKIISAFPGVGKTYLFDRQEEYARTILDSDSSQFSWLEKGIRHPDFPSNYISHIKSNIGKVDIILVSSHEIVRKALQDNDINYSLVFPNINDKEEYVNRFRSRKNDEKFIEFISNNWENFIEDMKRETFPEIVELPNGWYLTDLVL